MKTTPVNHLTLVWAVLILATAGSWLIGLRPSDGFASDSLSSSVLILLIAGVKIWLVMDWFMELREGAARVRWAARVWLLSLLVTLLALTAQAS